VIVVDASTVIEWLLGLPRAEPVAARLESEPSAHAPHLLDLEVAQVLRRLEATGRIEADRGRQAIDDLADLDLGRHPHDVLLPRVWQLRQNLTAYDAVYVALAEALDAPLLTLDRRLARATSVHAIVQVVE
jgi:predicted nucleic acid-binding protein